MNSKIKYLTMILYGILISKTNGQIDWQDDKSTSTKWASACYFEDGDLSNKQVAGDECARTCASTFGCTHFTWNSYNGGTCWMKRGNISESNAGYTGDQSMVCGIYNISSISSKSNIFDFCY
jgi:hypothetical protein